MTFSRRTRVETEAENALSRAVRERRARTDLRFFDLTVSNPTTAGLPYDVEAITNALAAAAPAALAYEPHALGTITARESVAVELSTSGIDVSPERIAITASTSEAYAVLFKMLGDPGDEILVPVPSYPLLAWLAAFEGVTLKSYPLEYAGRWHVDLGAIARAVGPRTRAIVVVSPNNPTGSFLGKAELEAMLDLGLPIISDEVFATYPLVPASELGDRVDSVLRASRGLVFALSGLSKLAALPQMKLGWIACGGSGSGPGSLVGGAMQRLETILDAYLSVGAPVQHALPALLRAGKTTANAIRERTRANLEAVRAATRRAPSMTLLQVEGGWYATLRVPATRSDEEWALALLADEGVYVHPGYFFDLTRGAHLVVSLLTPEAELREGMARIAARVERES